MDVRATRRGTPAVVFWGGIGVLAWATLTVLLSGGSAHADDQEDGPLDGLTSLVGNTVSAVTAPVAPIVTEVVAPAVTQSRGHSGSQSQETEHRDRAQRRERADQTRP